MFKTFTECDKNMIDPLIINEIEILVSTATCIMFVEVHSALIFAKSLDANGGAHVGA